MKLYICFNPGDHLLSYSAPICISSISPDKGVLGRFPALPATDWVTEDSKRLIGVVLNGLEGSIRVYRENFINAMRQHSSYVMKKLPAYSLTSGKISAKPAKLNQKK